MLQRRFGIMRTGNRHGKQRCYHYRCPIGHLFLLYERMSGSLEGKMKMTRKKACARYEIPEEILLEYESWNLCGIKGKQREAWRYGDEDLELLKMIVTLWEIGFEPDEVRQYMILNMRGEETAAERMQILNLCCSRMREKLHAQERQLEYLDYLRYKIQNRMDACSSDGKE